MRAWSRASASVSLCALALFTHCTSDTNGAACDGAAGDAGDAGDASIDASVDGSLIIGISTVTVDCPSIAEINAAPYHVDAGGSAMVKAKIRLPEAGTPVYSWSAPSGSFADPTASQTTFLCASTGTVLLTFVVSLGGCRSSANVPLECGGASP